MSINKLSKIVATITQQMNYMKVNGFPGLSNDISGLNVSEDLFKWKENNEVNAQNHEDISKYEEIDITLPYAGTNFCIRLLFNLYEPWVPPDMMFSDSKFMKKISVEDLEKMVPILNNWSYSSEDTIAQLLKQLHHLYKNYQLKVLEEEELLQFEYKSLLESLSIEEEDVEISLSGGNSWLFSLMIRLPLSLKEVPPSLIKASPGVPSCLLHVSMKKSNGTFTPKLFLSPQVENLIGGSKTLGLPSVPAGSSLSDYITTVLRLLEERVKNTILCFEMRKQFIAQLLCHFGSALLEYDAEQFLKASLLFDWKNFYFILVVDLPEDFPKAHPIITLRSVYHSSNRNPYKREITELDVPAQSTPEEIVKAIKLSVLHALPDFQSYTINNYK